MNREQKAAAVAEIAENIREAEAVFAVDYRGISVPQAAELRAKLREADARFRVVKNTLTQLAAEQAEAEALKELLEGPTALTFVRGDVAAAAKALSEYARAAELLPFKGGLMEGAPLSAEEIQSLARLPTKDVLHGQLVGLIASPISGLVRTLNALIGGLAIQLGQIRDEELVPREGAAAAPGAEAPAEPAEEPAAQAPAEAGTEPTDADEVETPEAQAAAGEAETAEAAETPETPEGPPGGGAEEAAGETEDTDAGPAGSPEPAQPDQAEGEPDADKTE